MNRTHSFRSLLALRKSLESLHHAAPIAVTTLPTRMLLEGRAHVMHAASIASRYRLQALALTLNAHQAETGREANEKSLLRLGNGDVPVLTLSDDKIDRLSMTSASSGVVALFEREATHPLDDPLTRQDRTWDDLLDFNARMLILDNVADPGNVGSIIRSAVAFRCWQIVLLGGCAPHSAKVAASSVGTVVAEELSIIYVPQAKRNSFMLHLASLNSTASPPLIVALVAHNQRVRVMDMNQWPASQSLILILGNESTGVSADLREIANRHLTIPLYPSVESLNVAACASIVLHAANAAQNTNMQMSQSR